jgi:hypothetical protein
MQKQAAKQVLGHRLIRRGRKRKVLGQTGEAHRGGLKTLSGSEAEIVAVAVA